MNKNLRLFIGFFIVSATLVMFQNCGSDVKFGSDSSDGLLVVKEEPQADLVDDSDPEPVVVVDDPAPPPVEPPQEVVPPAPAPPPDYVKDDKKDEDKPNYVHHDDKDDNEVECVDNERECHKDDHDSGPKNQDGLVYNCILDGPGRSKRAGYISEDLLINGHTPDTICTTRKGCEIVAAILPVKESVERGSCRNNPNVIKLNEDQLKDIVDKHLAAGN